VITLKEWEYSVEASHAHWSGLPISLDTSQLAQVALSTGGDTAAAVSSSTEKTLNPAIFAVEWRRRGKDTEINDWNKVYQMVYPNRGSN
jgi:hypothetical protein